MAIILFTADDDRHGRELWVTDGTPGNATLAKDINPSEEAGSNPTDLTALGGKVLFQADDGTHGTELWVTDGTIAGTSLLKDINSGQGGNAHVTRDSNPSDITALGSGKAVFSADGGAGPALWVTDCTAAGAPLVTTNDDPGGVATPTSAPADFAVFANGRAIFEAADPAHGVELWQTDSTPAGTSMVQNINASWDSLPSGFTKVANGDKVLQADDGMHGAELWVTDGTSAGTSLLKDIDPAGSASGGAQSSAPSDFAAFDNGKALFRADDGVHGAEVWLTDGTSAGTAILKDIDALHTEEGGAGPQDFTDLGNGKAVFWADDGVHGTELWVTDGTSAGTSLLADIHTGDALATPIVALGNGKALFSADDGTHGYELWETDGATAHMVKDIKPGADGSFPSGLASVGSGHAIFSANEGANGIEIWMTDGTAAGTYMQANIAITGGSYPRGFVTPLCFLAGTGIATPDGEVPVEALRTGDTVLTHRGEARPVIWIGRGTVLATPGARSDATPVIVRKGALAENVPDRDLHVTKGHALYVDEVLIPAEFLVNHRSIVWDDRAQEVEFYHVELAAHDVLVANGTPAESYRDDGNRWLFENANDGWHEAPKAPCAPVLTGGPVVDAIWRRLLDRSGPQLDLPTTVVPDLHLEVDGRRVDGRVLDGGVHVFRLLKPTGAVRVVSRASAQDALGLARDPRLLGVALRRVMLSQGRHIKVMEADHPLLWDGFHAFEAENGFRWTDGNAVLPAVLFAGVHGICELTLAVACTARYGVTEEQACIAA
jgi:ELWxxDGT repeat protein